MKPRRFLHLLLLTNALWLIVFALAPAGKPLPFGSLTSEANAALAPGTSTSRASARRTELVEAAEKVSPSIVSVGASRTTYMVSPFFDFFSDFAIFPYQEKIPYLGSGVIVSRDGLIVTNAHVIEQAEDVFVTLSDGREMAANVIAVDSVLDLAILKVAATDLPAIKMGDSDDLMVGEWVLAMGNPFGNLIGDPHPTVTVGVVSALKRSFRSGGPSPKVYQDMIQTDAAINPGNSGGALINAAGELVGINTFIVSRSGGSIGIGFAIPVNRVKSLVEEVTRYGRLRPKLVDFRVQNVNPRIARILGARAASGAVVAEIQRTGPAYRAGLRVGDIITSVNGHEIRNADDIFATIWAQPVGTPIKCEIDRGGRKLTIEFKIADATD
ncbi:MAG: trypsin-like peptidase domain-containing protein [Candidatus Sumerlaeaceae bacterium]|nr:trypsin-like peptidase domain-containing protein [Candidatus Sumerlaeaceae bacterium]